MVVAPLILYRFLRQNSIVTFAPARETAFSLPFDKPRTNGSTVLYI